MTRNTPARDRNPRPNRKAPSRKQRADSGSRAASSPSTRRTGDSLYDHPAWYDLAYGTDWRYEFHFLVSCFRKFAQRPIRRLFEPACGTGRLLLPFAKRGVSVGGIDLNANAVDYCNARLKRHRCSGHVQVGDMSDFTLPRSVDAAFNTINSFRHLLSHDQAEGHLRCIANALAPGGLYILGLHLTPLLGQPIRAERWAARRGNLALTMEMKTIRRSAARREERVRTNLHVYTPTGQHEFNEVLSFRTYTAAQFTTLLEKEPRLEPIATFDFEYQVTTPITVDSRTEDVVYVLRKRADKHERSR